MSADTIELGWLIANVLAGIWIRFQMLLTRRLLDWLGIGEHRSMGGHHLGRPGQARHGHVFVVPAAEVVPLVPIAVADGIDVLREVPLMRGIAASRREQVIPGIVRCLSGRGRPAFARRRVETDDRPADDDAVSAGFAGLSQDRSQGGLAAVLRQRSGPRPLREDLRTLSRARP